MTSNDIIIKILAAALGVLLMIVPVKAHAAPPTDFQTTQIIGSGISGPTGFEFAPDGRVFILERTGAIKIYKNGQLLPSVFATLPSVSTGDRGLIGVAFDPNYATNHFVYFYYTNTDLFNYIVRFDASSDVATSSPIEIYHTTIASNQLHVGGTIQFGPDGMLYLSVGDNGNAPNAQSLANPFGKILRMKKDGTIPADNPFVGQSGANPYIWAYGLRNPFRFQFDSVSGRLFEGDVGNSTWEEINLIQKGGNYGWPTCEGVCSTPGMINPIYAYNHNSKSAAAVGGPVYHGQMFPASFQGNLFFGDYAVGFIKRMTLDGNGVMTGVQDFDTSAGSVVDLKIAADGSLWYITYFPGRLYRTTYSATNGTPTAVASADTTKGISPLLVHFSSAGSFDPEGQPLTFLWNFGDNSTSSEANPTKTYNNQGTFTVELSASDGTNVAQSSPLVIQVGLPPIVTVGAPQDGSNYKAGDTIFWSGSGTDGAGLDLPDSAFSTEVVFHHGTHIHPFLGPIQAKSGSFLVPVTGEASPDTWFEIKLTGMDSNGLATTKSIFIYPQKVNLTFQTNPSGLTLLLDGSPIVTPETIQHVIGFNRTAAAQSGQIQNGKLYGFSSWSDGGAQTHTITAPASDITYTANFVEVPVFAAQYFSNPNLSGDPMLTRSDSSIQFDWGGGSPDSLIPPDNFSARWTGGQSFAAGSYVFETTSDDGVRLFVDGQAVIDKWIDQPATLYKATVNLTAGMHQIKMEYYENGGGAVAKLSWSFASPPPAGPPSSTGLAGAYFNNSNFTMPILTRVDPIIDFNWGGGSPDSTIGADTFSIRWTGQVKPQYSEAYTFYTSSDDGVRLWVNDQLLIDKWIDQGETEWNGFTSLIAGQLTNIKMEYYENGGGAVARLKWSSPSTPKQIIPQAQLFPTSATSSPPVSPPPIVGWLGEYWNMPGAGSSPAFPTSSATLTRTDANIVFDWMQGSPDPTMTPDHFAARWTRQIMFESGTYHFSLAADDGIRLYLDNQLVIDKWIDQGPTTYTLDKIMTAGDHAIKVEYYENEGGAVAKFDYNKVTSTSSNGLQTIYYDNIDLTGTSVTRIDPRITFNWGNGSPDPAIGPDTFSARWTGFVEPQYSETYTFYAKTDDGVRVWVNNQLIIDKWTHQSATEWSGQLALTAGQRYAIKMEYFEKGGSALAHLRWSSISQPKQIIPQNRLFQ